MQLLKIIMTSRSIVISMALFLAVLSSNAQAWPRQPIPPGYHQAVAWANVSPTVITAYVKNIGYRPVSCILNTTGYTMQGPITSQVSIGPIYAGQIQWAYVYSTWPGQYFYQGTAAAWCIPL